MKWEDRPADTSQETCRTGATVALPREEGAQQRAKMSLMIGQPKNLLFGLCLFSGPLCAQTDSVRLLDGVLVEQTRLTTYRQEAYTLQADSALRTWMAAASVADLLRRSGLGTLRSYGPSGLATASLRGGGSQHTAVLWNGINIGSPLNGLLDLSLLPVALFEEATVESGGAAGIWGSGAVGGAIHLNNTARFNEGWKWQAQTAAGSFQQFFQDAATRFSNKQWHTSTRIFRNEAENDFPFTNTGVFPARDERRAHNAFRLRGLLHQTYFQPNAKNLIAIKWWNQHTHYQVPNPVTVPRTAEATEENTANRALLSWNHSHQKFDLFVQSAFLHHALHYRDPRPRIDALSIARSWINHAEINRQHGRWFSTAGLNFTLEQGQASEIARDPARRRLALFYAGRWTVSRQWRLQGAVRQEWLAADALPVAPSVQVTWQPASLWNLTLSGSRNYRIPTLNDLYWRSAGAMGNSDLKTETAASVEAVTRGVLRQTNAGRLSVQASVFSNDISNWIMWTPVTAAVWTPVNLKRVWARGGEAQVKWQGAAASMQYHVMAFYRFTRSTNAEIYENRSPNELGRQLPFVPVHEATLEARAQWRSYTAQALQTVAGRQFTDGDNTPFFAIPAYALTHLWLSREWRGARALWRLTGEVNNLFDTPFVARPGFPMPGRNYRLTLQFELMTKPN
jgi:iron complex outermembrane receptor protein